MGRGARNPKLAPTKTESSNRTIPPAQFVGDAIAAHITEHGTGELGLILHLPDGRPIGRNRFVRIWRAARAEGVEQVDYHDLRNTFASTSLSGRSVLGPQAGEDSVRTGTA